MTWNIGINTFDSLCYKVKYLNNMWFAFGKYSTDNTPYGVKISYNGETWIDINISNMFHANDVEYLNEIYYITGNDTSGNYQNIKYSYNGIMWLDIFFPSDSFIDNNNIITFNTDNSYSYNDQIGGTSICTNKESNVVIIGGYDRNTNLICRPFRIFSQVTDISTNLFYPNNGYIWNEPVPKTIEEAINRLANAIYNYNGNDTI
jgi:hypothetical protein